MIDFYLVADKVKFLLNRTRSRSMMEAILFFRDDLSPPIWTR